MAYNIILFSKLEIGDYFRVTDFYLYQKTDESRAKIVATLRGAYTSALYASFKIRLDTFVIGPRVRIRI